MQFPHIALYQLKNIHVRFEVVKEVPMKSAIVWDKCCVVSTQNHLLSDSCWLLAWLILHSWQWRWHVPPQHLVTLNIPHGIISHKTEIFKAYSRNASAPEKIYCWYNDIKHIKNDIYGEMTPFLSLSLHIFYHKIWNLTINIWEVGRFRSIFTSIQ
jgi:hypothetical protein